VHLLRVFAMTWTGDGYSPVLGLSDFAQSEVFLAYGASDKWSKEDFDLDEREFR